MTDSNLRIRIASSIGEVSSDDWDACAAGSELKPLHEDNLSPSGDKLSTQLFTRGYEYNPFISHSFLSSIEASNSVGGRTGWQPRHLLVEGSAGTLLGAAPCYVKTHSQGEYVFDQGWAEAFERAGGDYYPKLQVAVPFTPVTGSRLLARASPAAEGVRQALADALVEIATASELSSAHVTFLTEAEWRALGERGFLQRTDQQFHWTNAGYASFDDFLSALSSRKRKTIRRERKDALSPGIDVRWLTGSDLTEIGLGRFFRFLHGHRLAQMGPALFDA